MTEDLVLTPGGYRPRSKVHFIAPGHALKQVDGRMKELDSAGNVIADLGQIDQKPAGLPLMPRNVSRLPEEAPAFGSGWICYADWTNQTGSPISYFTSTWTVPPAPGTTSGQAIFLFNGIQNSTMIYQPVLQWGPSGATSWDDPGSYWAVASWYQDGQGGNSHYSTLTKVSVGDVLVGVITLTGQSRNGFSYNCEFIGIPNSRLPINDVDELTFSAETLEVYGITKASDYPEAEPLPLTSG